MEGKKISFGFMKTKKVEKPLTPIINEEKREYIECVEEKSIKVVGGEIEVNEDPLVIPMKPNTLITAERLKEIAEKVEGAVNEPEIKEEFVIKEEPTEENETLDQMAVRELIQEAQKDVKVEKLDDMAIPAPARPILAGEKESREIIARVYHFFEEEYNLMRKSHGVKYDLSPLADVRDRTAKATGVSKSTLDKILEEEAEGESLLTPIKKPRRKKPTQKSL